MAPDLHPAQRWPFDALRGFFVAESLPDSSGRLLITQRRAKLGIRAAELSVVDRFALVGRSGRGALVHDSAATPADDAATIDLDVLVAEAQSVLVGEAINLIEALARLGGASGGARSKLHLGLSAQGSVSVGQGPPDDEHKAWIVNFPAQSDPVDIGPIEEAYARMLCAAEIVIAPSQLLAAKAGPGGERYLALSGARG